MLFKKNIKHYALSALNLIAGVLLTTSAFAASSTEVLEKNAPVYAATKKIEAFRVPTVDSTGKIKYYNVSIDLNILHDGSIDKSKAVINTSSALPVLSNKVIAGTHVNDQAIACTASTSARPKP